MSGTQRDPQADPAPLYRRLPHGPHGMDREDVARHQRARLYGGMIESIAQRGYSRTTVAHVIGLRGRLAAGLLRAVRQQGRVLPGDLRHRRRPLAQAGARGVELRARLGQPPARILQVLPRRHRGGTEGRPPRADRLARHRPQGARTAAPRRQRLRAPRGRGVQGLPRHGAAARDRLARDRRRCPPRRLQPHPRRPRLRAAHAHRRTARLGRGLPLARRHPPERDRAQDAARHPARARGLPGQRRQARAGARLGRAPHPRRRLRRTDRSPDRAVRGHLHRGLPQAVREQGRVLPHGRRRVRLRSAEGRRSDDRAHLLVGGRRPRRGQLLHRAHRLPPRPAADGVHRPLRSRPRHDRPHDQVDRPLHRHARRNRPRAAPRPRDRLRSHHRSGLGHHQRLFLGRAHALPALPVRPHLLRRARSLHRPQGRDRRDRAGPPRRRAPPQPAGRGTAGRAARGPAGGGLRGRDRRRRCEDGHRARDQDESWEGGGQGSRVPREDSRQDRQAPREDGRETRLEINGQDRQARGQNGRQARVEVDGQGGQASREDSGQIGAQARGQTGGEQSLAAIDESARQARGEGRRAGRAAGAPAQAPRVAILRQSLRRTSRSARARRSRPRLR